MTTYMEDRWKVIFETAIEKCQEVALRMEKSGLSGEARYIQQDLNFEILKVVRRRNKFKMTLKLLAWTTRIKMTCLYPK